MYNTYLPNRAELPTSMQLMQSTIVAAIVGLLLLLTVVMPSEFGLDPTGVGRVLRLKQIGEIKISLAAEAENGIASAPSPVSERPVPDNPPIITKRNYPELSKPAQTRDPEVAAVAQHQMTITLKPNEAAEVKLQMLNGARVSFRWTSTGPVNVDAHGDPVDAPKGFYHGYGKERQVTTGDGIIQAAFDGKHGWFWRNQGKDTVTIQISISGAYQAIRRVI
ncbi:transmembrane anchor protein [Pantoea vagans]|uniref:transmembrane anchor protein n=1 Tax=Pantoea vagans TaxID=470934 RepID=UPI00241C7150|nr:transmembrane anchor protein [Pantoea vagans]